VQPARLSALKPGWVRARLSVTSVSTALAAM